MNVVDIPLRPSGQCATYTTPASISRKMKNTRNVRNLAISIHRERFTLYYQLKAFTIREK